MPELDEAMPELPEPESPDAEEAESSSSVGAPVTQLGLF
jgi:hypothetical protein